MLRYICTAQVHIIILICFMIMIYDIWLYDILCPLSLSINIYIYVYIYTYGCESKCKAPIHTLNPQADQYPRSIPNHRWSRPIHTSGSPGAYPYPNSDATPIYILSIYLFIFYIYIYHAFNHMHVIRLRVDITAPVFRFTLQPRILSNGSDLEHSLPETRAPPSRQIVVSRCCAVGP